MIRISVISNVYFEPYLEISLSKYFLGEVKLSRYFLNNIGEIRTINADFVLLHLNLEELSDTLEIKKYTVFLERFEEVYKCVRKLTNAQILWLGCEDYYLKDRYVFGSILPFNGLADKLNLSIADRMVDGDVYIDLKRMIAETGLERSYDDKGKHRWNSPYSKCLVDRIASEIYDQYCISYCKTKKCLILDCDGVLWDGVLNEDGADEIFISDKYRDFQRFVLKLYYGGVILCLCTKNNEKSLINVLENHSEMILRKNHFSLIKSNYRLKSDNIIEVAHTLNISLDSIVFLDDSEQEIKEAETLIPDVSSLLFDPYTIYEKLTCFKLKQDSIDISNIRTTNYNHIDQLLHLSSVVGVTEIHSATKDEYKRISELSMRTNQKTNGIRFTLGQLKSSDYDIISVYYQDSINNYGLIGTIITHEDVLLLFSLSCRVIGKGVEKEMVSFLKSRTKITSILFKDTKKNQVFFKWLQSELGIM